MANETLSSVSAATLSANTTMSENTVSAKTKFNTIGDAAKDSDKALKDALELLNSAGKDGRFGINVGKIEEMKTAIDTYVGKINGALAGLNSGDATLAFGTDIGAVVSDFVASIKESTGYLVTNINAFKDDLDKVKEAYEAKEKSVTNTVSNTSSDLRTTSQNSWQYNSNNSSASR